MGVTDHLPEIVQSAKTLPAFIRAVAEAYGDAPALELEGQTLPDEAISFAELERRSAELARGLLARGVGKGSRVGFCFGNGPSFAVAFAAITRIGGVAIPVSTLLKASELVRVLRQSDVAGLILQRTLLGTDYIERVLDALPALRHAEGPQLHLTAVPYLRWIVSSGPGLPPSVGSMQALLDAATQFGEDMLEHVEAEVYPTDQVMEIYTSGSMAQPKGVRHDHGPLLFRTLSTVERVMPERGALVPVSLPMFWIGGIIVSLMPNLAAGAISSCTEGTATNSAKAFGNILAPEELELMKDRKPFWGVGMSETIGCYSFGNEFRAPGRPLCPPLDQIEPGFEVRVVDKEDRPVADGEIGEIQIRGYPVTPGLHKIERAGLFTPDGYYRTGDLGEVEGSRIHFVGRSGDMIKSSGSNVSPAEVEMELQQLDGVESAYVVGLPDQERGQIVAAALVPREGVSLEFGEIQKTLRERLSSYKVPRAYLAITRQDVPMLVTNKVSRRELASLVLERLGRTG